MINNDNYQRVIKRSLQPFALNEELAKANELIEELRNPDLFYNLAFSDEINNPIPDYSYRVKELIDCQFSFIKAGAKLALEVLKIPTKDKSAIQTIFENKVKNKS